MLNLLSLGLPIVILQVYDRILPNAALDTLSVLTLGLCAVLLLDGLFRTGRSYIVGWNAARFEHVAGCRAVDRLLGSDIAAFEKDPPGVHLDRLQAVDQLRDYYAGQARLLLVDLPFVGLFLGLIWFIAGSLVLIPIVLLVLLGGAALVLGRKLKVSLEQRAELDDRRYSFIIEVLSGIQTVKLMTMEALMQRRYERLQEHGAASTFQTVLLSNIAQNMGALITSLAMVSVATAGALSVMSGQLTIGGLAACTLLSGRAVQPLLKALGLWAQLQSISIANDRLDQVFRLNPESGVEMVEVGGISGAFELRGVSFAYDAGAAPLLDRVSLKAAAGEVIGITGDTGIGKTTLLMLVMGVLKPTGGRVLFDDNDIAAADPQSLRRQIAYLPQNAALLQGTILENLTMFRGPEALDDSLAAARLLGLDEVIHRLPAGYDTLVGDGAQDDLPAGMTQGIAMARALATRPRLLLFDEANSAFDSKTDKLLKAALNSLKGKVTMVLVSHRPSLLDMADRVYELEAGALVPREPGAGAPIARSRSVDLVPQASNVARRAS